MLRSVPALASGPHPGPDPGPDPGSDPGPAAQSPVEDALDVDAAAVTLSTVGEIWRSFLGHVPLIVGAVGVLLLTWALAQAIDAFGTRALDRWKRRESLKELILRLIYLLIWVLGLLLAAIVLFPGLTPSRALGGLGLVSIAVGLAFKDIFENFFAGILILWRFPFERGDFVECQGLVGRVERVLVRMTYIRKTTGELVVVPNSFLFKNPVTILTSLPERRVTVMLGVAYGEDLADAVALVERTVAGCATLAEGRPVQVFAQGYGDSGIDVEVTWWTGATPLEVRTSRHEVVVAVKAALDAAGVEIPFPYRTLVFKGAGEAGAPAGSIAAPSSAAPRGGDPVVSHPAARP